MRLRRGNNDDAILTSVETSTATGPAVGRPDGSRIASPKGTTATISGDVGQSRTVTVTDSSSGRVIGKIDTDPECKTLRRR